MRTHGWAYAILDEPHGKGNVAFAEHGAMIYQTLRQARKRKAGLPHPDSWSICRVYLETEPFALLGNGREKV